MATKTNRITQLDAITEIEKAGAILTKKGTSWYNLACKHYDAKRYTRAFKCARRSAGCSRDEMYGVKEYILGANFIEYVASKHN